MCKSVFFLSFSVLENSSKVFLDVLEKSMNFTQSYLYVPWLSAEEECLSIGQLFQSLNPLPQRHLLTLLQTEQTQIRQLL